MVPSDKKWFTRLVVSQFLVRTLETIDPQYPTLPAEKQQMLGECRARLTGEESSHVPASGDRAPAIAAEPEVQSGTVQPAPADDC